MQRFVIYWLHVHAYMAFCCIGLDPVSLNCKKYTEVAAATSATVMR